MATLYEYYEKEFNHSARIHIKLPINDEYIEGMLLYDFASFISFISLYISDSDKNLSFFIDLLSKLKWGATQLRLGNKIILPNARVFPGKLKIINDKNFEILAQYYGDEDWISTKNIKSSKRVFIYSESDLNSEEIKQLKAKAKEIGHDLQFRAKKFKEEKNIYEKPLAFISHDSRDRELVTEKIAFKLQSMLCPVWYDEFTLKIGDNLRESIEKGLKECKKCILILSPNFLSNKGWTKKEFDSIFTREVLEEKNLVLPVWYNVSEDDVYNYSPSLLNIKGIQWDENNIDKICSKLYKEIMD